MTVDQLNQQLRVTAQRLLNWKRTLTTTVEGTESSIHSGADADWVNSDWRRQGAQIFGASRMLDLSEAQLLGQNSDAVQTGHEVLKHSIVDAVPQVFRKRARLEVVGTNRFEADRYSGLTFEDFLSAR